MCSIHEQIVEICTQNTFKLQLEKQKAVHIWIWMKQWTVLVHLRYFPTLTLFTSFDWVNSKNNVRQLR